MDTAATSLYGEPADVMSLLDVSERLITVGVAETEIAALDGERVYLSFNVVVPGGGVWVSLNSLPATNMGTPLNSSGEPLEWEWLKHSAMVQSRWVGISSIGGADITVREMFYRRRRPKIVYSWNPIRDNSRRQRSVVARMLRGCTAGRK